MDVHCDLSGCNRFEAHEPNDEVTPPQGWVEMTVGHTVVDFCSAGHAADWLIQHQDDEGNLMLDLRTKDAAETPAVLAAHPA